MVKSTIQTEKTKPVKSEKVMVAYRDEKAKIFHKLALPEILGEKLSRSTTKEDSELKGMIFVQYITENTKAQTANLPTFIKMIRDEFGLRRTQVVDEAGRVVKWHA